MKTVGRIVAPSNELLNRRDKTPSEVRKKLWRLLEYIQLSYPLPNAKLRLTTDSSDTAAGGVLKQEMGGNVYKPLYSDKITIAQQI